MFEKGKNKPSMGDAAKHLHAERRRGVNLVAYLVN